MFETYPKLPNENHRISFSWNFSCLQQITANSPNHLNINNIIEKNSYVKMEKNIWFGGHDLKIDLSQWFSSFQDSYVLDCIF